MRSCGAQPCEAHLLRSPALGACRKPFRTGNARANGRSCHRQLTSVRYNGLIPCVLFTRRSEVPGSLQRPGLPQRRGALKCEAASGSTVRITTQHEVAFGEVVKAVGTQEQLGAWDPAAAPGLTWAEGNKWSVDLALPPDTYEFKLVVVREDGSAAEWEPGTNREIKVEEAGDEKIVAECAWSDTATTVLSIDGAGAPTSPATESEGAAAQVEAAEAEAESAGTTLSEVEPSPPETEPLIINQASKAPKDSEAVMPGEAQRPVGDVQQDDAENALEAATEPEGELEEPTPSLDKETPTVPGGADEWGPAGGGEMGSVDEADVEKQERSEVQQRWADNIQEAPDTPAEPQPAEATPEPAPPASHASAPASASATEELEGTGGVLNVEAQGGSVAEAAASPLAAAKFEAAPTPQQIASGTLEVAAEGGKVADAAAGPVAQAVFKTDAAPSDSSSPPAGLQVLVGTLGLFAAPVVAWSLYTLSSTGCGLPPGPGGLLGALEGLSYVTLLGLAAWSIGMKATTSKGLPAGPGGILGAAEGLSYLTLAAGAVVLVLQVKNYGYVPSALPDAKCFGDEGPKSPSDITRSLADAFASKEAPRLSDGVQEVARSGQSSSVADAAASSSRAAAPETGGQGTSLALGWLRPPLPGGALSIAQLPATTPHPVISELAATEADPPVAPADAAVGQAVQAAKRRIGKELTSQQDRLEEVYSGALDGLSGADIAPAVEELETLFTRLARVIGDALPSLGERLSGIFSGADKPQPPPAAVVSGWLSGAVDRLHSVTGAEAPACREQIGLQVASPAVGLEGGSLTTLAERAAPGHSRGQANMIILDRGLLRQMDERLPEERAYGSWTTAAQSGQARMVQVAFDLSDLAVSADIGFTAAATNAVTAAVNVNSQLTEQVIAPLRAAAGNVRRIADEISRLAAAIDGEAANGRRAALAESAEALQAALGSATQTVSGANSGLPALVAQLQDAVAALKQACPPEGVERDKVGRVVRKLEAATVVLREAAESGEVSSSLQSAQKQVEALELPGAGALAASETQPALASIEKAVDGLHSVLAELDAAVGAAKDISAPSAPPLKD